MTLKSLGRRLTRVTALSALLLLAGSGCPELKSEPYGFYYDSLGQTRPLYLTKGLVGVRFEEGVSEEERAAIVAEEPFLCPYDNRLDLSVLDRIDMTVLRVRKLATETEVLETIARLDETAGVAFATPVLHAVEGRDDLLTDEFYASFEDSVPEDEILALNAEHAVEVVEVEHFASIGKVGYTLRVTADSGMNALDMANLYYEHPLTIAAGPVFQPLYSVLD